MLLLRRRGCSCLTAALLLLLALSSLLLLLLAIPLRCSTSQCPVLFGTRCARTEAAAGQAQDMPPASKLNRHDNASSPSPACTPIDIAMVVVGTNASRSAAVLIKSIMQHRTTPLRLHFLVDEPAQAVLQRLLDSWRLQAVAVHFYNVQPLTTKVAWIPTVHSSGLFGLVKVIYDQVLSDVDIVLALDVDLLLTADPALLFQQHLSRFTSTHIIGASPQQSGWYLGEMLNAHGADIVWPARGRGINSGVMLLHLQRMRSINWPQVWTPLTKQQLAISMRTGLADQDIFNLVHVHHPELVYLLPCSWNVQLHEQSLAEACFRSQVPQVLHWNSPQKLNARFAGAQGFRRTFWGVQQLDGAALRRLPWPCAASVAAAKKPSAVLGNDGGLAAADVVDDDDGAAGATAPQSSQSQPGTHKLAAALSDQCRQVLRRRLSPLRVHMNYYEHQEEAGLYECALLTMAGSNVKIKAQTAALAQQRYLRFIRKNPTFQAAVDAGSEAVVQCQASALKMVGLAGGGAAGSPRFEVTLLLHLDWSRLHNLQDILSQWDGAVSVALLVSDADVVRLDHLLSAGLLRQRAAQVKLHLVFADSAATVEYPVNLLRNVAWDGSSTSHVLMLDIDLLPSPDLCRAVQAHLEEAAQHAAAAFAAGSPATMEATVIPAFETGEYRFDFPSSGKEGLKPLMVTNQIRVFRQKEWPQGHAATDYARWWDADTPYSVAWQEGYEPYVVLPARAPR